MSGPSFDLTESMRIATFNVQNLRLRHGETDHLDGARDGDVAEDSGSAAARFDRSDRRLTAAVLRDIDADVVALQEVFDRQSLDHFHDRFLLPSGAAPYPYRVCLPGNDGRGNDVAVLSRIAPSMVKSHAAATPADLGIVVPPPLSQDQPIFRRDCLEVTVRGLTLFVCHFKAPYPDPKAAWPVRRAEAAAVRRLIERRFPVPAKAWWLVLGDLNEPWLAERTEERAIAPLLDDFAVDLAARMTAPERWSYFEPRAGRYSQPDAILASPALAAAWPNVTPYLVREGVSLEAARYHGPHLPDVGGHRPHASDHAALVAEFAGL
jgi:endonuclease/exonuclease/phosphatase family metal-dependent hydrolase